MSKTFSRLAAIGLLIAVIAAAIAFLILPAANYFNALRAEITQQRGLLARFEAFAANKEEAQLLSERAASAVSSGVFLEGETDALRTANLQALITKVAQEHGVRLSSTRVIPVQEEQGLRFIGVQAELNADTPQLQAMLLSIEAQRPFLFVRSLQVVPSASRRSESDELRVRFAVVGAAAADVGGKS